jgi:uncharacterized protein
MKIAVIGSGVSGLSAAYYLSKKHQVDLFEKDNHFGGHAYTLPIQYENNKEVLVDIGFMVFNKKTYPNLIQFFSDNQIEIEQSDMSFSVSVKGSNIEYCGQGLGGIFSNRTNLLNPKFIRMFFEIINFYSKCNNLNPDQFNHYTLGDYLKKINISEYFINFHIIPMVSAIWSMPPYESAQMPLRFFISFFKNHGLFQLFNRPQWYTVSNRSKTYVDTIIKQINGNCFSNLAVNKIKRENGKIEVICGMDNQSKIYDKVVMATHADITLQLLEEPSPDELRILKHFNYRDNVAVIHSDETMMPANKKAWCSWNSLMNINNKKVTSVTYWLNKLQNLTIEKNIFLTINPLEEISENKIFKKVNFTHPYYDLNTLEHQNLLTDIQNKENILFCGSYFGYGFHEDGIKSSIDMLKSLND